MSQLAVGRLDMEQEKYLPKQLFVSDFKPDGKLAQFMIEMGNVVGAMQEQAQTVAKHGVRILSGFHDAPTVAERGTWSFFADFTGANIEPEVLATGLRSLRSVLKVRCQSTADGLIVDNMHFPRVLGTERAIIVRSAVLASMIDRINSIFGSESKSAHVVLHQVGEAGGLAEFEFAKAVTGADFIKKNVSRTFNLYTALGYGITNLTAIDFERKAAEMHVRDSFECKRSSDPSGAPQSHFIRGLIAGWFSQLFETKMDVIETQCVAKGNPACVFQVQPFKS